MAAPNIGELTTAVLRQRSKKLVDNITKHNALFHRLKQKDKVKPATGSETIDEGLEYALNQTVMWYSEHDTLNVSPSEVFDTAQFNWKQMAGFVTITGLEEIKNSGEGKVFDLLSKRISNLHKSLREQAAIDMYKDGVNENPKGFGGLKHLVQTDPSVSSVVGGIQQADFPFWRNQALDIGDSVDKDKLRGFMSTMWLKTLRGGDKTDLIVVGDQWYQMFESSLEQYQRFGSEETAKAGFESLKYKTADIIYDDACPGNYMYFLNTDYLYLRPHPKRTWHAGKEMHSYNQDSRRIPVFFAGNMTCSNRAMQGVIWT